MSPTEPVESNSESMRGEVYDIPKDDHNDRDIAAELANKFHGEEAFTGEEVRRLRWKLDFRIIPLVFLNVVLPAMDKVSHGTAALYGLQTDLNLVGNQYSWIGSVFYFGYLVWCFPSGSLLQKLPLAKTMAIATLLWGIVLIGSGFVKTFSQLMACRFLLGLLEAPVMPGNMLILSMWYTRPEQALRYGLMYTGFSTCLTGPIGYGIGFIKNDNFHIWQSFFWICGSITFAYGIILLIFLPDNPVKARFINEREKAISIERVRANQTGIENKTFRKEQVLEAFLDIRVWLMFLFNIWISIPNGGLTNFSPLIVKGLGYNAQRSSLLTIPNGVIQTASSYICNGGIFLALKYWPQYHFRGVFMMFGVIVGLISTVFLYTLPIDALHSRLAAIWMSFFYLGPYIIGLSLVGANTAGHTKKVTVNAMMFVSYCASNIISPQFFKSDQAPLYPLGIGAILGSYILSLLTIAGYMLVCWIENRRRDARDAEAHETVHHDTDFKDLTDIQNLHFRYVW
ncbi:major facilitator superfamily domain-containing protein [Aspergillus filifer]